MVFSIPQLSFTGGIWAPSLWTRADLDKYQSAAADIQNLIVRPHGGLANRAGTKYLGGLIDNTKEAKLVPFQYSIVQSYLLVCEAECIRFIKDDGWIIEEPGNGDDLRTAALRWTASANGTDEYYVELVAGGDPIGTLDWTIVTARGPAAVRTDVGGTDVLLSEGIAGALEAGEWDYGDNDTLGFNTIYVRLSDGADPDTKALGWLEAVDYIYVTNPWSTEEQIQKLKWTQSADVIYFFAAGQTSVFKLTRSSHYSWTGEVMLSVAAPSVQGWRPAISSPTLPTRSHEWHSLNDSVRYQWTQSNAGGSALSEYYLELKGGGDPGFGSVYSVRYDALNATPVTLTLGTLGSLSAGQYAFGQSDGQRFSTIYVRVTGDVDPDTLYPGSMAGDFRDQTYVITAVSDDGEESYPSVELDGGLWDTITWTAPTMGAGSISHYNFYRRAEDSVIPFGFIGTNKNLATFKGTDIIADVAKGPPEEIHPFAEGTPTSAVQPSVGTFFEQRLLLASPNQYPQTIWGSWVGFYRNLLSQIPVRDDCAFEFTLNSNEVNNVLWMMPSKELIVGTAGGVWVVKPGDGSPVITPASIDVKRHTRLGSADVIPEMVGSEILYVQHGGRAVRGLRYSYEDDGYVASDLSIMANHLFDSPRVIRISWQREPHNILWALTDGGVLYGMTYSAEHGIAAWHQHWTMIGQFKDMVALPEVEGSSDNIYFLTKRQNTYMIEKLGDRFNGESKLPANAYFVDCGLYQSFSSAVTLISGLKHLEGYSVDVLADGNLITGQTVSDGKITLANGAKKVSIGIPLYCRIDTLELALPDKTGTSQDKAKAVTSLVIQVEDSRQIVVSPIDDNSGEFLTYVPFRTTEDYGDPTELFTGKKQVVIDVNNMDDPRVKIQARGVPLTILGIFARGAAGDY